MATDVVISFDTTGSMSPCIAQVRRKVAETITTLFKTIPDLRIGLIAHGDYCDGNRAITKLDLGYNANDLIYFVKNVPNTGGGDSDECYELVLHEAGEMSWRAENRALILIGDALPHRVGYRYGDHVNYLSWQDEAKQLAALRVMIYAVEALGNRHEREFYQPLADMTNGRKLDLYQFADAVETIQAIAYHSTGDPELLDIYREELQAGFKMNRNLARTFQQLSGVKIDVGTDKSGLIPVSPFRFQMVHVDGVWDIRSFVQNMGATFKKGRGFYQFTKTETVQEMKEVILRNKRTGDLFTGAEARNYIGLPFGERGTIAPHLFEEYEVYIQSTSVNRKLLPGTKFLYEVEAP